jgi:hypothetical protein
VDPQSSFSQRAVNSPEHEQPHNAADDALAGRADEGSTTPARVGDESTPRTDKLKEEIRGIIREMIRSGELPPP